MGRILSHYYQILLLACLSPFFASYPYPSFYKIIFFPSIRQSSTVYSLHLSLYLSFHPSLNPSTHTTIHPSTTQSIHPSLHLFIQILLDILSHEMFNLTQTYLALFSWKLPVACSVLSHNMTCCKDSC